MLTARLVRGVLWLVVVCSGVTGAAAAWGTVAGEDRPLAAARPLDAVVVEGARLTAALGKPISTVSVLASRGGMLQPVPFQVDELTAQGERCLEGVPAGLSGEDAEPTRDDPPGILDGNDELVFMADDAGPRVDPAMLPPDARGVDELGLTDPLSGRQAFVYVVSYLTTAPRSPERYVQYTPPRGAEGDHVRGRSYHLAFSAEAPVTPHFLALGDDINLIDRMKIRFRARVLGLFSVERTEADMGSRLWRYGVGPVRVTRQVRASIRLVARLQSPAVVSEMMQYRDAFLVPFRVNVPFNPNGMVRDAGFTGALDCRGAPGWTVRLGSQERWLDVGARQAPDASEEPARWFVVRAPGKALLASFHMRAPVPLSTHFVYNDDATGAFPPEAQPGEAPLVGFAATGIERLPRGPFGFHVLVQAVRGVDDPEELTRLARLQERPLGVTATAMWGR